MSLSLRTTILATGCILAIGTSAARAQMPLVFYYSRAGQLRHDAGDGQHPGRRLLLQRAAQRRPGSGQPCSRAQGFTYSSFYYPPNSARLTPRQIVRPRGPPTSNSSFYYPRGGASTDGRRRAARMLVATTRTTRTGKPSRRKPMHRIPRSYSPLLAWDAPR